MLYLCCYCEDTAVEPHFISIATRSRHKSAWILRNNRFPLQQLAYTPTIRAPIIQTPPIQLQQNVDDGFDEEPIDIDVGIRSTFDNEVDFGPGKFFSNLRSN